MHIYKSHGNIKNHNEKLLLYHWPLSSYLKDRNVVARFDEIPSKILRKLSIPKILRITKGNNSNSIGPYYSFIISFCLEDRNMFARFGNCLYKNH